MNSIVSLKNPTHHYTLDEIFTQVLPSNSEIPLLNQNLSTYQLDAISRLPVYFDIKDFDILEIGADEGNCLNELVKSGTKRMLGINNWCAEEEDKLSNARFELTQSEQLITRLSKQIVLSYGDIRQLAIADNSFDLIFSIATFEHIQALDEALIEMHRLLKPKGFIYANFGPVWSGAIGHHLWCEIEGRTLQFSEEEHYADVLQRHEHLLYSAAELKQKLSANYSDSFINELLYRIYEHPHINRYSYADYRKIIMNSPFKVLAFKKLWQIPTEEKMLSKLQQKYGYTIDFNCSSLEIVLQKQ